MPIKTFLYPDCVAPQNGKLVACTYAWHRSKIEAVLANGNKPLLIQGTKGTVADVLRQPTAIFRGLGRPHEPHERTVKKSDYLAYVGRPDRTHSWDSTKEVWQIANPPIRAVFVVWVAPNLDYRGNSPNIEGWIDHFGWVDCDTENSDFPKDYKTRYEEMLWPLT